MSRRPFSRPVTGLAAVLVALLAGCTPGSGGADADGPRLIGTECPPEVEVQVVPEHSCGFVVTTGASGAELRIFVVTVEPPAPSDQGPVLETGTDLGMTPGYAGLAPIAQRTGRRVVIVDLPGTGHSTPSLDCPEVRDVSPERSSSGHDRLVAAVAACRARLRAEGVEPSDASAEAMGEVLYDVMLAIGDPRWAVMGHGTSAVAAIHLTHSHPDRVEALVLDSMVHHDHRPVTTMAAIVAGVADECRAQPACVRRYGDPALKWRAARRDLDREPLALRAFGRRLALDEAELVRVGRWVAAPDALGPERLPQLLDEAARGGGPLLEQYAAVRLSSPPHCVGSLPKCQDGDQLAFGAVLSSMCAEVVGLPGWRAPCRAWGVTEPTGPPDPLTGVPVLALHGRYDPFAAPRDVRTVLDATVPEAFVVESPSGGHNVLAGACIRSVRNAWLTDPQHLSPIRPGCLSDPLTFD